ncbi:NPCBM/NEW2 domain-containing protein [Streptomyces sp. MST-110588]|uniref:NPCBM/NEW2 domain-containing protein n=1 Tax=Streptomyces sp. MST-110588 TaxID=2833628 RepID=UPI001F5C36B4|nr:NPCBM/NEW2 domain-containing protein [Streptomyces sp. MST-110588]UNO38914.1 NPCBM/NEW2 domain-containing protein [Streptomyces sp. MST-110588]
MRPHTPRTIRHGRRRIVGALSAAVLCTAGLTALPATARAAGPAGAASTAADADDDTSGTAVAPRLPDGLAKTPPMGFNNWNSTYCRAEFNEAMIKGIADLFVEKGLKAAGYQYVNIDDCWARPTRDAQGKLVPHPTRFPNGIKAVADYIHSKGLKFGLYTSAGTRTCDPVGMPGALGHEASDARQFAEWGVDYLKYDNCNNQGLDAKKRYITMRDALKATGRPIVYSICEWGENKPWLWAADVGHLWRTTGDIKDNWASMVSILKKNLPLAPYAGPGHWNDPDMLEVGNGGMSGTEYRSHFSMWSMMAAPLLIGTDLRKATPETFEILNNREVIALDQDPLGKQGTVVKSENGRWTVAKQLAGGDRAVALFNETDQPQRITTTAKAVGLPKAPGYRLRDLWKHQDFHTTGTISATVPAHGTVVFRASVDKRWAMYPPAVEAGTDRTPMIEAGHTAGLRTSVANLGRAPARDVEVGLTGPQGWRIKALSPTRADALPGGKNLVTSWQIVPPDHAKAGAYELTLTAGYRSPGGQRITSTPAAMAYVVMPPPRGTPYASDLPWLDATNGWGPVEKDTSVGEKNAADGKPIAIGGVRYAKGLGTHAPSAVTFYTGGRCTAFRAQAGIDDESGDNGSVTYEVWADGKRVAATGILTGKDPAKTVSADVSKAHMVKIVVTDAGNGMTYDHADWADAKFTC